MSAASSDAGSLLWVDRYRPSQLSDLALHPPLTERLQQLARQPQMMPHLLFYGPNGAGKHTRVQCVLRELFGPSADRVRIEHKSMKLGKTDASAGVLVDLVTVSSPHHIELNPSDYGIRDRLVVQEVIKEIAQSRPLDTLGPMLAAAGAAASSSSASASASKAESSAPVPATARGHFKVVVINEVDGLSRDAQHALRRTMEKYVATCRLILCASSACRVLEPIRSRCLAIRVPAPSEEDVSRVLQAIARREKFLLPSELAHRIAVASGRNMRKAVLSLEATRQRALVGGPGSSLSADTPLVRTDWEEYIAVIAADITREQTPACLLRVRERMYELLSHCIPGTLILRTLTLCLLPKCDDAVRVHAIRWAAEYEHRLHLGSKDIFHLEAFVARFMALYRRFLQQQLTGFADW